MEYGSITTGDVTMSQLKSRSSLDFNEYLDGYTRCQRIPADGMVRYFKVPYHLRAQTSLDRMPGGWEWGTKYGDTHDYVILGIRFESRSRL